MIIRLHKNAKTTPAVRAQIAASCEPVSALASRWGISQATVRQWKKRGDFLDRPHTPHHLPTTLTPAQEILVVELRKLLWLPLDDLLSVVREFIHPKVSRAGLARCLRRYGVSSLSSLRPQPPQKPHQAFKPYEPGFVHIDVKPLPVMPDENKRQYLFVAIDRATRWVFIAIKPNKTARSAASFLRALHKACPVRIRKILTDNGAEFTDRLFLGQASGKHQFDRLCQALSIEHRLTPPRRPQTNGMVERFNGRIADVLKSHRFVSGEDLKTTLYRYVTLYNHSFPQSSLGAKSPLEAMQEWFDKKPNLFVQNPYNLAIPDS